MLMQPMSMPTAANAYAAIAADANAASATTAAGTASMESQLARTGPQAVAGACAAPPQAQACARGGGLLAAARAACTCRRTPS